MPTRNINLTEELDAAIRARVASGRYENASEVVRAALRVLADDEERQEAHVDALRRGWELGREQFERGEYSGGTAAEHMERIGQLARQRSGAG